MDQIEVDVIDPELLQAVFTSVLDVRVGARPLGRQVDFLTTPARPFYRLRKLVLVVVACFGRVSLGVCGRAMQRQRLGRRTRLEPCQDD